MNPGSAGDEATAEKTVKVDSVKYLHEVYSAWPFMTSDANPIDQSFPGVVFRMCLKLTPMQQELIDVELVRRGYVHTQQLKISHEHSNRVTQAVAGR